MPPAPRVPKFRVPAAFVSPAALCLVGGICYYFTLDFASEDELNSKIGKEFPQVVRTNHEVDDRMREFFKRVNNNDPREEERMRNLLNKGKGSHYSAKRRHATPQEIEEFGFVPKGESASPPSSSTTQVLPTSAVSVANSKDRQKGTSAPAVGAGAVVPGEPKREGLMSADGGITGAGAEEEAEGGGGDKPRKRRWWFW